MRSEVLIRGSVLSEKSVTLAEAKTYTLKVDCRASKNDIKIALKDVFGVDAVSVRTAIVRGRTQRKARHKNGGPVHVKRPNVKKAFVQLRDGQSLPTLDQMQVEPVQK